MRLFTLIILLFFMTKILFGQINQKLRVLVLTDIENEPDDAESLVRFLLYSNMFDVEGLVATTSCWQRDQTAEWRTHVIPSVTDDRKPALTRYQRVIINVMPELKI